MAESILSQGIRVANTASGSRMSIMVWMQAQKKSVRAAQSLIKSSLKLSSHYSTVNAYCEFQVDSKPAET